MKSSFKFIINKKISFKFFSAFLCNLYKYNLIIFIFNFINSGGAFFKFFFTFFFYNLYKYNLIIFIFNKKIIINNI